MSHPGNFHCSPRRNISHKSSAQLPPVSSSVKQKEFCSVSHAVNKKWPLKLGACPRVHREVGFPSHRPNKIRTRRRGIPPQHFPGHNSITCVMELPSYGITAKTKTNEQVLLINHANNLQKFLFSFLY